MSNQNDDRELKLARLLQELIAHTDSNGEDSDLEPIESELESLSDHELQELHAAGNCLNLLQKLGHEEKLDRDETVVNESCTTPTSDDRVGAGTDGPSVPSQIGRFEINKLTAQGGMARIYRATDTVLQRDVALKIPLSELLAMDSMVGERFRREGQAVALLSHPAIVPVFDAGEVNGQPYIAFRWIAGSNLQQFLKTKIEDGESKIDPKECAFAVKRIAAAVAHAHSKGILHRDIKPANILIEKGDDETPWYKRLLITDFGLAKAIVDNNTVLTANESIIGTPAYMSPEAVKGDAEIDQRADVYSLGVLLYELIVGAPPHKRSTYVATIRAIESDALLSPSALRDGLPSDLEAVCMKCLAIEPADRYADAFELEVDLERFVDGRPVLARRISSIGKIKRWAKRNPLIACSLTFAFMSLLVGIVATTWMWGNSEANRKVAVLALEKAENLQNRESVARREAEVRADELARQVEILRELFSDLDPQQSTVSSGSLRERLAEKLIRSSELISNSSQLPSQRTRLMGSLSQALAQLGRPNEAHAIVKQAIEIAGDRLLHDEHLHLQLVLAFTHMSLADYAAATEVLEPIMGQIITCETFTLEEKVGAANLLADSWFQIAATTSNADSLSRSKAGYRKVLELLDPLESVPDNLQAIQLATRFRLVSLQNYPKISATQFDSLTKILEQAEIILGTESSVYNTMMFTLANYYADNGHYEKGIQIAEQAWRLAEENFGATSDIEISALNVLVTVCGQAGKRQRLREILPIAQKRCETLIERKGESHGNVIVIYGNVSIAWGMIGELEKCIDVKRRLVEISTEKFGRSSPQTQNQLVGLGAALRANGDLIDAKQVYDEFQSFIKTFPDRDQPHWKKRARIVNREQMIIGGLTLFGNRKRNDESN